MPRRPKAERKRIDAGYFLWGFVVLASLAVYGLVGWVAAPPSKPASTIHREIRKPACFIHPNIPDAKVCGLVVYHWQNRRWAYMGPLKPYDPAVPEGGR